MKRQDREEQFRQWASEYAGIFRHVAAGFAAPADQEDLLQEILLAVWHALPSFRSEASPATFLYRVAQNTAMTWRRSVRYRHLDEELDEGRHAAPPPDRKLEKTEALYAGVRKLPEADRSLLLLYLDEISYREISEITGLSESNVGVRLTRIRHRLASVVKESHA